MCRGSFQRCSVKEVLFKVLQKFTGKQVQLAQVFSCEFCEIFKNIFFYTTPPVAASKNFPEKNQSND